MGWWDGGPTFTGDESMQGAGASGLEVETVIEEIDTDDENCEQVTAWHKEQIVALIAEHKQMQQRTTLDIKCKMIKCFKASAQTICACVRTDKSQQQSQQSTESYTCTQSHNAVQHKTRVESASQSGWNGASQNMDLFLI